MDFIIRFAHTHETFRKPEIEALAILVNINVEFLFYSENVRLISPAVGSRTSLHSNGEIVNV